jgi:cytochrome c-type biogenesis protein CcmH
MNIYVIYVLICSGVLFALLYPVRKKKVFCAAVSAILLVGGVIAYRQFGTPEIIPMLAQREERLLVLKETILQASEAVKKDNKNIEAWLTLADSFMETSQFSAASNAYKQAVLLSEGNPAIIMAYARSMIIGADGVVSDDAKRSLDMVRMLQPENSEARYYQAVYMLQAGKQPEAMAEMKDLYHSLPEDSPLKDLIDRQIGRK